MITFELFLILNLTMNSPASYWWLIVFLICDGLTWHGLKVMINDNRC